jgi:hypothetical protein
MNRKFISQHTGTLLRAFSSRLPIFLKRAILVAAIKFLLIFCFEKAAWSGPNEEIMPFFTGARMLAMGGAQVAVANDETALLANPAGLGKIREYYGTIFDPEIDVSQNYANIIKTKSISNPFSLEQVSESLTQTPERYFFARAQVFPSFVVRNFGIGFYYRQVMAAEMNATATSLSVKNYDDMSLVLGYNLRLWDGRIKIGVAGRAVSRIEINKTLAPATDTMTRDAQASEGVGFAADAGLILAAPWTFIPTVAVVVRDVGGTKFEGGKNVRLTTSTVPTPVTQDYDVGVALFPILTNRIRSTFTLEYQKVIEAGKASDKLRYAHGGYEMNIYDTLFLRIGMNQRYVTGGIELASESLQFQLSTYGVDVGTDGSPKEDRRGVFKVSWRF